MKKLYLFSFLFLFASLSNAQHNVLLIIADDLGTDYCGFYEDHGDTVALPHIASLLNKGIRFQNAMSNPVCSPTRAGLLTGRYSFRTGVGNVVAGIGGSGQLDTAEVTIPRLLKIYNPNIGTADIGKWHLHTASPASHLLYPNVLGYDRYEGPFIGAIPDYYNWTKYINGVPVTVTNYATSENVDNAVDWLKTQTAKPFFLWLAFNAPHTPYHLPPAGMYSDLSLTGTQMDINANPKKYFKASLEALDHEIGRLFDSLQAINRLDSTDIIFIGDNGNATRVAQIADTSRAKGTVYQYGVHVPMIISGPSIVNPGRVSSALVNTHDLFATILELFDDTTWQIHIPINKPVDSKSILPIIKNQNTSIRPWSFTEIFKLIPDADDGKAIRNMDYKLISFDNGNQEFYHLATDSNELINLLPNLNSIETINYNYLCAELTNLVGAGNYCQLTAINEMSNNEIKIYPNPFHSNIRITFKSAENYYELSNTFGQIIYSGQNIESKDLSFLSNGLYYLRIINKPGLVWKLNKD